MPGPYIHISSMLRTARELADGYRPPRSKRIRPDWAGTNRKQLAAILKTHSNLASLGAIGPDLFFFLPDFRDKYGIPISSVLVFVLDFLRKLYSALDPYLSKWPLFRTYQRRNRRRKDRLTGGLSETIGNITGELISILITALEDFVTQQEDWWDTSHISALMSPGRRS